MDFANSSVIMQRLIALLANCNTMQQVHHKMRIL
jgi:hypothetical protein